MGGESGCLMPLCLPFEGKKVPEDPGADTVDFPKRTTPAKGTFLGVCVQGCCSTRSPGDEWVELISYWSELLKCTEVWFGGGMFLVAQVPVKTLAVPQTVVRMLVVFGRVQRTLRTGFLELQRAVLP